MQKIAHTMQFQCVRGRNLVCCLSHILITVASFPTGTISFCFYQPGRSLICSMHVYFDNGDDLHTCVRTLLHDGLMKSILK